GPGPISPGNGVCVSLPENAHGRARKSWSTLCCCGSVKLRAAWQRSLIEPVKAARAARLRYVNDQRMPGIQRRGSPGHFTYVDPRGRKISNTAELERIRALVIPPAWKDVWICPVP